MFTFTTGSLKTPIWYLFLSFLIPFTHCSFKSAPVWWDIIGLLKGSKRFIKVQVDKRWVPSQEEFWGKVFANLYGKMTGFSSEGAVCRDGANYEWDVFKEEIPASRGLSSRMLCNIFQHVSRNGVWVSLCILPSASICVFACRVLHIRNSLFFILFFWPEMPAHTRGSSHRI